MPPLPSKPPSPAPGVFAHKQASCCWKKLPSDPWVLLRCHLEVARAASALPGASSHPGTCRGQLWRPVIADGTWSTSICRQHCLQLGMEKIPQEQTAAVPRHPHSSPGAELASPSGQGQHVPQGKRPRDLMPQGEEKAAGRWVPTGGFPGVSWEHRQDLGWQQGQEQDQLQSN